MAEGLIEDGRFFPTLAKLTACLERELDKANGGKRCFTGLTPAGRPPLGAMNCDGKECGIAWVSPIAVFPSTSFPIPDEGGSVETLRRAGAPLAMEVQMGVARCYPTPRGREERASLQAYIDATRLYLSDMAAMRRAIACCMEQEPGEPPLLDFALGQWAPLEPEARAGGGTWQFWIGG